MTAIRIGHSPDPDDAFLFYGITQGKIPLNGLRVEYCLQGIEELNQRALRGELEMTAISLHAYAYCADRYILTRTGASVGDGYGPVVVAREDLKLRTRFETKPPGSFRGRRPRNLVFKSEISRRFAPRDDVLKGVLKDSVVAVPGKLTTASLLLQLALGQVRMQVLPFDEISEAVRTGKVAAGVLIHEGQITYAGEGLRKVMDLGEWWQGQTGLPVPLGVNALRRDLGDRMLRTLASALRESLDYALAHRAEALAYARRYGRGLDDAGTARFVGMYVNRWAVDCRPDAAVAMQRLLDQAAEAGLTPRRVSVEFVDT